MFDMDTIQNIYTHLQDDESQRIFEQRLLLSSTGDRKYLYRLLEHVPTFQYLCSLIRMNTNNIVFGAGYYAEQLLNMTEGCWLCAVDNNAAKWGKEVNGVPICSPEKITEHPEARIFICTRKPGFHFQDEIVAQLQAMPIPQERIIRVDKFLDRLEQQQYFDLQALPHVPQEVFVDGGAYDGDSVQRFVDWANDFSHIYAFEPDEVNGRKCINRLEDKRKITLIPAGLGLHREKVAFSADNNGFGSHIDAGGDKTIDIVALDEVLSEVPVTFIKLDIEGAELDTLKGGKELICKYHPKLAVCVYHKPEDIIAIPQYILSLQDDYHFYLRHYGLGNEETVLYCI